MSGDKEGKYCSICGGITPDQIKIRKILVGGRETGIDQLDRILSDVSALHLDDQGEIRGELVKRAKVFNYIPTKKTDAYADALMEEYRQFSGSIL
ncbi:MAG: NAC family transcription factor [Methanoregulaceae archaeon]|jgi:hypothetical protein|nr:NAC family transcription factor [Methanoregulaceae archaeon]